MRALVIAGWKALREVEVLVRLSDELSLTRDEKGDLSIIQNRNLELLREAE